METSVTILRLAVYSVECYERLVAAGVVVILRLMYSVDEHRLAILAEVSLRHHLIVIVVRLHHLMIAVLAEYRLLVGVIVCRRGAVGPVVIRHLGYGPSLVGIDDEMALSVLRRDVHHVVVLVIPADAHRHHARRIGGVAVHIEETLLHDIAESIVLVCRRCPSFLALYRLAIGAIVLALHAVALAVVLVHHLEIAVLARHHWCAGRVVCRSLYALVARVVLGAEYMIALITERSVSAYEVSALRLVVELVVLTVLLEVRCGCLAVKSQRLAYYDIAPVIAHIVVSSHAVCQHESAAKAQVALRLQVSLGVISTHLACISV